MKFQATHGSRLRFAAVVMGLLCGALALSTPAYAQRGGGHSAGGHSRGGHHGGHHGGWGWAGGVYLGSALAYSYPWPGLYSYPYAYGYGYAYPYGHAPAYAAPAAVAAVPSQPPVQSWYYCDAARAYYPHVASCPGGWRAVPAVAPDATPAQ